MKAKEFGSWASSKMSKGGFRAPSDEFNKSFKGQQYRRYKEYASSDLEEYHKYPGTKDLTAEEEEKKQNQEQQSEESKSKNQRTKNSSARQSSSRITRNLVSRVVAITAGSIVLVNTNPVLAERFPYLQMSEIFGDDLPGETTPYNPAENDPTPADALTPNWTWSEDHESASLELLNGEGALIATIPATVRVVEEKVETCTEEGSKVYTASAEREGTDYSDSYSEVVPPIGHTFGNMKISTTEDGQTVVTFECENCHEQYSLTATVEDED